MLHIALRRKPTSELQNITCQMGSHWCSICLP